MPSMVTGKLATGQQLWTNWHLDAATLRFVAYNRWRWRGWAVNQDRPEVLCNLDATCLNHVKFSYLMNVLAREHGAVIKTFTMRPRGSQRRLVRVYQSWNTADCVSVKPYRASEPRVAAALAEVWPRLADKRAVYDMTVAGIWIGVDIYETYLRKYEHYTLDVADPAFRQLLAETVGLVFFWRDYFAAHDVRAVGMSIDGYTANNTVTKVAQASRVPVYTPDLLAPRVRDVPFAAAAAYPAYRRLFAALPPDEQGQGLARARQQLAQRLSGVVGVNMPYSTRSAFHRRYHTERLVRQNARTKALICAHDFVDAPHSDGGMLFTDFYEWLMFVAQVARETDYDWYLKKHADHDPFSVAAVRAVARGFPHLTVVPATASHHQLADEGITAVLTCYGSVGHEYPLLGVPVINAGYNPHVAYGFNYHARTVADYRDLLKRLSSLTATGQSEDVYEFYYMHHYDELADTPLKWWQAFLAGHDSLLKASPTIYDRWQAVISEDLHVAVIERLQQTIPLKVHHLAQVRLALREPAAIYARPLRSSNF